MNVWPNVITMTSYPYRGGRRVNVSMCMSALPFINSLLYSFFTGPENPIVIYLNYLYVWDTLNLYRPFKLLILVKLSLLAGYPLSYLWKQRRVTVNTPSTSRYSCQEQVTFRRSCVFTHRILNTYHVEPMSILQSLDNENGRRKWFQRESMSCVGRGSPWRHEPSFPTLHTSPHQYISCSFTHVHVHL